MGRLGAGAVLRLGLDCDRAATFDHALEMGQMSDSPDANSSKNIIARAPLTWLVLIAAEIIHGILRAIQLVPLVDEFWSNQIEVFTGSAIIFLIACLFIRWIGVRRRRELLMVGGIWLVLTVWIEVLFGRFVAGLSWERTASDYKLLHSGLMPVGLVFLFFSPMIAARVRQSV